MIFAVILMVLMCTLQWCFVFELLDQKGNICNHIYCGISTSITF